MNENAPIFRSIPQALHVAFLMASLPATTKGSTQRVLELLQEQAGIPKDAKVDGTINFGGLTPLEVRGQCSMIRGAVDHHCLPIERAALHAWFAIDESKWQGMLKLRDYCAGLGVFTIEAPKARMAIVCHIHATAKAAHMLTERLIAGEHGLSQSTVHRNIVTVSAQAAQLRRIGMRRLIGYFERDGAVESYAEVTA